MARTLEGLAVRITQAVKSCDVEELNVWWSEYALRSSESNEFDSLLAAAGYRHEDEVALLIAVNSFGHMKEGNYLYQMLVQKLGRERANWAVCKAFRRYARRLDSRAQNYSNPQQRIFKVLCRLVPARMAVAAFANLPVEHPYKIRLAVRPMQERVNERGRRAITAHSC